MSTKHIRTIADLVRFGAGLKIECGSCGSARTRRISGGEAGRGSVACRARTPAQVWPVWGKGSSIGDFAAGVTSALGRSQTAALGGKRTLAWRRYSAVLPINFAQLPFFPAPDLRDQQLPDFRKGSIIKVKTMGGINAHIFAVRNGKPAAAVVRRGLAEETITFDVAGQMVVGTLETPVGGEKHLHLLKLKRRSDISAEVVMRTARSFFSGLASSIDLPVLKDSRGTLSPLEFPINGFLPVSAFLVSAVAGAVRGGHGHHKARQLLVQVSGRIEVELRFGGLVETIVLDPEHRALLIEPGVWALQRYTGRDPALIVFSDMSYSKDDYFEEHWQTTTISPSKA